MPSNLPYPFLDFREGTWVIWQSRDGKFLQPLKGQNYPLYLIVAKALWSGLWDFGERERPPTNPGRGKSLIIILAAQPNSAKAEKCIT